ncbi:MAG TPA: SRPBCC family protein [Actinomycetota bacterium]|nr:SRPBCC family protein [Actinomycetota bacterium]
MTRPRWSDPDPTGLLVFTMEVEIGRPPEAVWPYLVDWERLDRWMEEGRGFRVVGERREGVGVEAEATIAVLGITTTDRIRVTRWEPPAVLEIEHLGWVRGHGLMEVGVTERGSHLFWREAFRPPLGGLGRLGMRLLSPVLYRTFRRDLQTLRRLIERET